MKIDFFAALISALISFVTAFITAILTSRNEIKKLKIAHNYELSEKERIAFANFVASVSKFADHDTPSNYADAINAVSEFRSFCSGKTAELIEKLPIERHAGNGAKISQLLRSIVEEYRISGNHRRAKKEKN